MHDTKAAVKNTLADIASLSIFSNLQSHPLFAALSSLLEAARTEPALVEFCRRWSAFTNTFIRYAKNESLRETIAALALCDENVFTLAAESGAAIPPLLKTAAAADLERLGRIAAFDIAAFGLSLAALLHENGSVEAAKNIEAEARAFWTSEGCGTAALRDIFSPKVDRDGALPQFAEYIRMHGAGGFSLHHFFCWRENGLWPIQNPDPVRLTGLAAYEDQRSVVIANTLRFIKGKPANNLLLHGDRGTGKSATIKAVCSEYAEQGLRLIEVRKSGLFDLPRILDTLAARSLRFIVFIDDLSFDAVDDSFTCLKAILEGSAERQPSNTVIYATSNRRHLVKERLSDRPGLSQAAGDEVRAFETMQEQFSLADRFGLSLVFVTPNQEEYLRIAEHIALRRGLLSLGDIDAFRQNALRWEKWFNGRSPRTAVQYVDWIAGGGVFPWQPA
jgi:predicted AAA+ superfamily ATPase